MMRALRILVALIVAATVVVLPTSAYATAPCSGVGTAIPGSTLHWNGCVYATAGLRARSHSGTGPVTGTEPILGTYPFGTKVYIYCYLTGASVTGPNGPTTIWDAVSEFQPPGGAMNAYGPGPFAVSSDAWIYTGSNDPVVPHC
jgi:hypothetical protein